MQWVKPFILTVGNFKNSHIVRFRYRNPVCWVFIVITILAKLRKSNVSATVFPGSKELLRQLPPIAVAHVKRGRLDTNKLHANAVRILFFCRHPGCICCQCDSQNECDVCYTVFHFPAP